jgi:hypothetical protein
MNPQTLLEGYRTPTSASILAGASISVIPFSGRQDGFAVKSGLYVGVPV